MGRFPVPSNLIAVADTVSVFLQSSDLPRTPATPPRYMTCDQLLGAGGEGLPASCPVDASGVI